MIDEQSTSFQEPSRSALGWLIYWFFPFRRRIILANIDQVYQDHLSLREKRHLAMAFYAHLAKCIKEMLWMRFMTEAQIKAKVLVQGYEHVLDVAEKNQGVLILTGHFGNWEFAPIGGILNFSVFRGKFHFIRRSIGARWLEKILFRRYFRAGLQVIPKKNSLNQVIDALALNHAVVFVLDQHASLANRDGIAVEFFGKKAGTYRSLAMLSRHSQAAVVPAAGYRLPSGQHVLQFYPPIPWQEHESGKEALYQQTLLYNQALEHLILLHPEQWWWLHKRWKLPEMQ